MSLPGQRSHQPRIAVLLCLCYSSAIGFRYMIYTFGASFSSYEVKILNKTVSKEMPPVLNCCVSPLWSAHQTASKEIFLKHWFFFPPAEFFSCPSFHINPNLHSLALRTPYRLVLDPRYPQHTLLFHALHKPTLRLNSTTHSGSHLGQAPASLLLQHQRPSALCYKGNMCLGFVSFKAGPAPCSSLSLTQHWAFRGHWVGSGWVNLFSPKLH